MNLVYIYALELGGKVRPQAKFLGLHERVWVYVAVALLLHLQRGKGAVFRKQE